ncbi:MAG: amidohydrolase family protein [Jatrophihabitans sp.]|uniref:amidohydrolase family protein n=1 Tax=Jatrophihabitans sp. TaxID=1932789 RepID=UPI003F7E9ABC
MIATLTGVVPGIIDAHIHQWDPFTTPRKASQAAPVYRVAPWLARRLFPLLAGQAERDLVLTPEHIAQPYLPSTYAADTARAVAAVGVPVEATVHVEASWQSSDPVEETAWVDALPFGEHGNPQLAGILGHADLTQPDVGTLLDRHLAASDAFRGLRVNAAHQAGAAVVQWTHDAALLRDPAFLRGVSAVVERGLVLDVWVYGNQLADVAALASEHPEATIVLDHYGTPIGALGPMGGLGGTPGERADIVARWRDDIASVAACPNVLAKQSGYAFPPLGLTEPGLRRDQLAELAAPLIEHTADVFGADRLVFGSNFPMDKAVADYGAVVGARVDVLAPRGADLLRKVFRENAERVYGAGSST